MSAGAGQSRVGRRLWRHGTVGLTLIGGLGVLLAWSAGPFRGAAQAPAPGDAALRELVADLLQFPDAPGRIVRFLPGQMPTDLPIEVPLPPGSRLLGGV